MVRPGLTGWAQVRYGYANNLEEEIQKLRFDLYYVKYASLWLDLRILFGTVKVLVCGRLPDGVGAEPAPRLVPPEPTGFNPKLTQTPAA
jgi:lipopolysaccharide/colanic/teichoic acid biosynthesis glycosyltransferase